MPLPNNNKLQQLLDNAAPSPWKSEREEDSLGIGQFVAHFHISNDHQKYIAAIAATDDNDKEVENTYTLAALAPQLAEEVIQLRDELDQIKQYCHDNMQFSDRKAQQHHRYSHKRHWHDGRWEAYCDIHTRLTQIKENRP